MSAILKSDADNSAKQDLDNLKIRRVTTHCGAEISGVDLREPMTEAVYRSIRQALVDHGVIFFRNQPLTTKQYEEFGKRFGRGFRPESKFMPVLPGSDIIAEVRKDEGMERNIGGSWHTDQSFRSSPSWGTMLLCREIPEHGGDTLWSSMTAAYDRLSDGLKRTLETLRAVHWNIGVQLRMKSGKEPDPAVIHPAIIRHPESGRKILYLNASYVQHFEGWTREESAGLLRHIYEIAQQPEFSCRFHWEKDSIAFWDNYQTWHYAVNDYDAGERIMHRIVVDGPPITSNQS